MNLFRKTINKLIKKNITISVAESCTGGLLSATITSFNGVSKIYNMGLTTYSNKSKLTLLKIQPKILKKYGAVSKEIAENMVIKLKKISNSKLCISTTGIAGPSGGTKKKPVGLVYIGIMYNKKIIILEKKFKGSRNHIQKKTIFETFKIINDLI